MTTSSCGSSAGTDVQMTVASALAALRSLQGSALTIYGRLEPERALNWTLEELGELAANPDP